MKQTKTTGLLAAKSIQWALLISLGTAGFANLASADAKFRWYQQFLRNQTAALDAPNPLGVGAMLGLFGGVFSGTPPAARLTQGPQLAWFTQRTDHNTDPKTDSRTFQQRYYVNSDYASGPGAPVLFFVCGEAACTERDGEGAPLTWAQEHGAYLVSLEHRFYGKSMPSVVAGAAPSLSIANLALLTTDQALQDLATFEDFAKTSLGLTGTWVSVGGSYPGSLSAYYRSKYPNEVVGALSSSGPVHAEESFQEYDLDVVTVAGTDCAATMRAATAKIEAMLDDPEQTAAVKALFGASDVVDPVDFLYVVADMGAMAIQYGFRDQFCTDLVNVGDPVQGYAKAGKQMFAMFGITALQDTPQGAMDENPDDYLGGSGLGMRSWTYQTCTEYGYFQDAYANPAVSVRSARINSAYDVGMCQRLFGLTVGPNIAATNAKYYQPLLDPAKTSAIFFTNGSTDPWSKLGITPENQNVTNPNTSAEVITGGSHCTDLGTDGTASAIHARATFDGMLAKWWPAK